jgi:alkanesulfonate monooxygenase SsuD/methylene tetrahydromethanopterin reductase-like flavin-dependent oxidoreductase (luciferase family)
LSQRAALKVTSAAPSAAIPLLLAAGEPGRSDTLARESERLRPVRPPLRVGIQLPEVEREVRWAEIRAIAKAAEDVGFDSIWLGDHMLYRGHGRGERGPWDVWTQLAALAVSTERVRLGPLVAATAFHPAGVLARMAASIDEVSGGRFVLGLGAGWNEVEFRAFGYPYDRVVSRFEEAFEIVRRLIAGERVTFVGRFQTVEDAVLLPRPGRRVPLMIGGSGPRLLGISLPHVEAWNTWYSVYGNTVDGFAALNAEVDATCPRAGREPREVARSACVLVAVDGGAGERPHDAPVVAPAALAEHLRSLAEAGADEAILVVDPITERSVRVLAEALA